MKNTILGITFQIGIVVFMVSQMSAQEYRSLPDRAGRARTSVACRDKNAEQKEIGMSVVRASDLRVMSGVPKGDVFLGGFDTDFDVTPITTEGVLVRISSGNATVRRLPFLRSVDDIHFIDNTTGWVAGPGGIFKTKDGGDIWHRIADPDPSSRFIYVLSDNIGWQIDSDGTLFYVEGERYQKFALDLFRYRIRMQFTSRMNGWIRDVDNGKARFRRTSDGGRSWTPVVVDPEGVYDFTFVNESDGFAVTGTRFYSTKNRGASWTLATPPPNTGALLRISFLDPDHGWSLGSKMCRITDSATNWNCNELPADPVNAFVRDFTFTDIQNGWILTENGLFSTNDGGRSWNRKKLKFGERLF